MQIIKIKQQKSQNISKPHAEIIRTKLSLLAVCVDWQTAQNPNLSSFGCSHHITMHFSIYAKSLYFYIHNLTYNRVFAQWTLCVYAL